MADWEKVINAFINVLGRCESYGYCEDKECSCYENVSCLELALELLKEKEPRVLTFDELMALPHGIETDVAVMMETKTPVGKWDGGSMCQWKPAGFVQEMVQDHRWYNREHYGEFWRVWNARPTVAQREEVKWDADD